MKKSSISPIMLQIAKRLGADLHIEPEYGYVGQLTLKDGRRRYFRHANFDLNTLGASEIAQDKAYAAYFLSRMGYPVPEGEAFFSDHWAKTIGARRGLHVAARYAKRLGYPVIVKPNSLSQGSGVHLVRTKRELMRAISEISKKDRVYLVQRRVPGDDYRIVVLDGQVISAYQRLPLTVTGDGRSTIAALLRRKQTAFETTGRDTVIRFDDPRVSRMLASQGLSRRSVLARGSRVALLPNANLSTGGDAVDVTGVLHPAWKRLCRRIARDMNLRYIGIDVMARGSLAEPPRDYTVLEVNAAAGLDNYAAMGKRQRRIVLSLYEKVFRAMLK